MKTLHQILGTAILVLATAALLSPPAQALQKTLARMREQDRPGDWNVGATCAVAYYNICTGWVWVWDGFHHGDLFGTIFDSCCAAGSSVLTGSYQYFPTGAPPSYGFSGYARVHAVDDFDCLIEPPLASVKHCPSGAGWEFNAWEVPVPERFAIVYFVVDQNGYGTPVATYSDGPFGCGVCFPTTRTTNSHFFGLADSTLCPPSPLHDGQCYVEWLAAATLACPVAVEDGSWGEVKNLYR
jgi:hypothetical protein